MRKLERRVKDGVEMDSRSPVDQTGGMVCLVNEHTKQGNRMTD